MYQSSCMPVKGIGGSYDVSSFSYSVCQDNGHIYRACDGSYYGLVDNGFTDEELDDDGSWNRRCGDIMGSALGRLIGRNSVLRDSKAYDQRRGWAKPILRDNVVPIASLQDSVHYSNVGSSE